MTNDFNIVSDDTYSHCTVQYDKGSNGSSTACWRPMKKVSGYDCARYSPGRGSFFVAKDDPVPVDHSRRHASGCVP
jgi:hypothetical protein